MTRADRSLFSCTRRNRVVVALVTASPFLLVIIADAKSQERGRREIDSAAHQSIDGPYSRERFQLDVFDDDQLNIDETFAPKRFAAANASPTSSVRPPMPLKPPSAAFQRSRTNSGRQSTSSEKKSPTSVPWGTTLFSLAVITGLIVLCAWVMRKIQPHKSQSLSTDVVEVLGRRPLDPRQQIYLIRCGARILVVGSSAGGMSTLAEINDPAEIDTLIGLCRKPTDDSKIVQSFQTLLTKSNWWQGNAVAAKTK